MSFYIYVVSTGAAVVFCFDTPAALELNLIKTMGASLQDGTPSEPLVFLQSMIVGEITKLYDTSIWSIRNHIRRIEKVGLMLYTADCSL
jgi:hypothetical protein